MQEVWVPLDGYKRGVVLDQAGLRAGDIAVLVDEEVSALWQTWT